MFHHAKNVTWGALEVDNSVTATFDIYDDTEKLIDTAQSVHGDITVIQQLISDKVKERSAAIAQYETITANTDFAIEMTQVG